MAGIFLRVSATEAHGSMASAFACDALGPFLAKWEQMQTVLEDGHSSFRCKTSSGQWIRHDTTYKESKTIDAPHQLDHGGYASWKARGRVQLPRSNPHLCHDAFVPYPALGIPVCMVPAQSAQTLQGRSTFKVLARKGLAGSSETQSHISHQA